MSIKKKLFSIFGVIIIILIGIALFSVIQMTKIDNNYGELVDDQSYKVIEASKIQNATSLQGLYIRSYVLRQNKDDLETLFEQRKTVNETMNTIEPLFVDPKMVKEISTIKEQQELYNGYVDTIIDYVDKKQIKEAQTILFDKAVPANKEIQQSINSIVSYQKDQMNTLSTQTSEQATFSKTLLIFVSSIGSIVAIVLAVIVTRKITIPLKRLTDAANIISSGDLREKDIVVNTKDEINELAQAFNRMKVNLAQFISSVSNNTSQTTVVAEQLVHSTDEVMVSTKEIAERMELVSMGASQAAQTGNDCATATNESAHGVGQIAEAAQSLNSKALDMQAVATTGGQTLETAEQQMMVIQQSSYDTKERIKQLSLQSAEIESITKVITDITEQTNLLALNAAIEAARAGEHGKGFAVVADEVRKLAEESKVSASKIVGLTSMIQKDTKEVEISVNSTVDNVDQGVTYLQTAQVSFNDIFESIAEMTAEIQEVSASSEELSASTEEVAASVTEMAQSAINASDQSSVVLASAEEQSAAMLEINEVAKSLNEGTMVLHEEINKYRV
ncbi:MAG: MCP four helix bundle domain-containing protein [Kurthia sp.]|nr:MCP four helix bundle domain-containing protein [Candidatus Kurthia equi]